MPFRDEGFFHALQQEPDNDSLRLVYADFLEDRGDSSSAARAEFIRVQIELAAPMPTTRWSVERTADLKRREADLLAEWERVWLGGWADVLDGWTFRRGLVEAVRADASVFLDEAAEWFAEWPTLTVAKLTRAGGHLDELTTSPLLAHLRGLDLSDGGVEPAMLAHLTASRFIPLLQALDLSGNPLGPRGAALLTTARSSDELREVHLARCGLGRVGLANLLGGRARQYRRLDLSGNGLERRDLMRLVDSPVLANLVAVELGANPLGDHGASVLADAPGATGLVNLGLCDTGSGDRSVAALASSPHMRSLRSLDLRGHRCWGMPDEDGEDQGGIGTLARSPLLGQLRRLLLGPSGQGNGWTAEVLRLVRSRRRETVVSDGWTAHQLRKSRYLVPSQLVECDVEELWWLGDRGNRERLPSLWCDAD